GGAALMKGVRPLHYSKTSMPLLWKKAMKGILPAPVAAVEHADDDFLPITTSTKKERTAMKSTPTSVSELPEDQLQTIKPAPASLKKSAATEIKPAKIIQSVVATTCPYCNHKQDLPIEKGKNGKPFFVACP